MRTGDGWLIGEGSSETLASRGAVSDEVMGGCREGAWGRLSRNRAGSLMVRGGRSTGGSKYVETY